MTRDPRINPLPGDMVCVNDRERHVRYVRTAIGGGGQTISYQTPRGINHRVALNSWRDWAIQSTEFKTRKELT